MYPFSDLLEYFCNTFGEQLDNPFQFIFSSHIFFSIFELTMWNGWIEIVSVQSASITMTDWRILGQLAISMNEFQERKKKPLAVRYYKYCVFYHVIPPPTRVFYIQFVVCFSFRFYQTSATNMYTLKVTSLHMIKTNSHSKRDIIYFSLNNFLPFFSLILATWLTQPRLSRWLLYEHIQSGREFMQRLGHTASGGVVVVQATRTSPPEAQLLRVSETQIAGEWATREWKRLHRASGRYKFIHTVAFDQFS